jgi:glycosyltransferase involved in cell wall biosynthesis
MGVLFIMPLWTDPAEVWMQRMIEAIEPHIAYIACLSPAESAWQKRIPTIDLTDKTPLIRRIMRKAGFSYWENRPLRTGAKIVEKTLTSEKVSVVLIHYLEFAMQYEEVWRNTAIPLYVHCHGYDVTWDLHKHENPAERRFDEKYIDRVRLLSERAILIANSHCTARRLADIGIKEDRIVIKYLGVPVQRIFPKRSARPDTPIQVLYLGRLVDFKGPDLVIEAFNTACSRGFDGELLIAGDGPLRVACEIMRKRSNYAERIKLLGAVDRKTAETLYHNSDIFTAHNCTGILSRQEEAFGVSVVEAMAAGLPVVSGRNGALIETVIDGKTGYLVEPGDVDAHADAFLRLEANCDLRKEMGIAGWQRVKELFSAEREQSALLEIMGLNRP